MIVPLSRLTMASAVVLILPFTAYSQADPSFKLSTTNATAASEFRAGMADWQNSSREAASARFKAAVEADPGFGLARILYVAMSTTTAQSYTELGRGLADASRAGPNEQALAAAYRYATLGKSDSALKSFIAASKLMPNDAFIAHQLEIRQNLGVDGARAFVRSHPNFAPGYNDLAYQSWFAGDRAGALAAAKHQVEISPNASNPHDTYAEILQWNGNFVDATRQYLQAQSFLPIYPEAYAGLAEVFALQLRFQEAKTSLNLAIDNAWNPQQRLDYVRQLFGTVYLENRPQRTLLNFIVGAKTRGDSLVFLEWDAHYNTDVARGAAVDSSFARQHADRSPGGPPIAVYFNGMTYAILKEFSKAAVQLRTLERMAAEHPGSVPQDLITGLGASLLTHRGSADKALRSLMAADTTSVVIMMHIAEAHRALNHCAEATAWYTRINANYQIVLGDFSNVDARREARYEGGEGGLSATLDASGTPRPCGYVIP